MSAEYYRQLSSVLDCLFDGDLRLVTASTLTFQGVLLMPGILAPPIVVDGLRGKKFIPTLLNKRLNLK